MYLLWHLNILLRLISLQQQDLTKENLAYMYLGYLIMWVKLYILRDLSILYSPNSYLQQAF